MKKKVLTVCLVAVIAIMAVAGASLAYLTDTDAEDNVFTVGNVQIDLTENFSQNSKLLPATGSAQQGTLVNGVQKEVFVTNTGSEDAYVRVHIAIPAILDNGDPSFDASQNVLHSILPRTASAPISGIGPNRLAPLMMPTGTITQRISTILNTVFTS